MASRSLSVDKNDQAKLRHGRNTHEGILIHREFGQACPFFFTREGAQLSIVGQYRGASAFLIGGGPSFGGCDKSLLHRVWTMTLNNSVTSWRSNANCIDDEPSRFSLSMWLDPRIQKFVPMAHFEKPLWDNRRLRSGDQWQPTDIKVGDCPNVVGYRRNEKFHAPRWLYEETINWGNHTKYGGGRSVLLASLRILYLLGFRKVYLLGVDFDMSPERKYHFPEDRTSASIRGNTQTYAKLAKWLGELQPYFLKAGYFVKNCNPRSNLRAFPFISYTDALSDATAHLGTFESERTTGMYQKLEEKIAALNGAPLHAEKTGLSENHSSQDGASASA